MRDRKAHSIYSKTKFPSRHTLDFGHTHCIRVGELRRRCSKLRQRLLLKLLKILLHVHLQLRVDCWPSGNGRRPRLLSGHRRRRRRLYRVPVLRHRRLRRLHLRSADAIVEDTHRIREQSLSQLWLLPDQRVRTLLVALEERADGLIDGCHLLGRDVVHG